MGKRPLGGHTWMNGKRSPTAKLESSRPLGLLEELAGQDERDAPCGGRARAHD